LSFVESALEVAGTLHRGSAMLLYGYRGSGKTSALRKIQSIVQASVPNAVVVEVPLRVPSSESTLVHGIAEAIRRQVSAQAHVSNRMKAALESLTAVNVLGTGVERVARQSPAPSNLLTVWKDSLTALGKLPLLCVCVDDAELLKTGEVGILKTMVETVSPIPILISVAGGPELMEKLSLREASPILRAFTGAIFDIGQFTSEETHEALDAPLKRAKASGKWDPSAVQTIHHLTHGYPYLVQCFAAATYRDGRRLTEVDVRNAIPEALRLASSWLERELPVASDEDIRSFVRIASLGRSDVRSSDVVRLGVNHIYISRLTAAGVLKRLARGHYELRMAPAIAYFHALRRGLAVT
jgi:energy-coupling factor transporter ATP-binding protein EcfA2